MSKALKVREALDKAWKGTKTIENKYDPFDWIAKGAAHTAEFLVPQTQEEALFELMTFI